MLRAQFGNGPRDSELLYALAYLFTLPAPRETRLGKAVDEQDRRPGWGQRLRRGPAFRRTAWCRLALFAR